MGGGAVLEGAEGVAEALGEVDGAPVDGVEQHRVPLTEGRRAHPQVDDEVDERARHGGHVLGLPDGHVGEVDPSHRAAGGDRHVGLHHVEPVPDDLGEVVAAERLEKHAASVRELARRDLPGAGDRQGADVHQGRSRPSAMRECR